MKSGKDLAGGIRLRQLNLLLISVAAVVAVVLIVTASSTIASYEKLRVSTQAYQQAQDAVAGMKQASDNLTEQVQRYAVSGDWTCVDRYMEEIHVTRRRDNAVETLRTLSEETEALSELETALEESNALTELEYRSMALVLSALDSQPEDIPEELRRVILTEEETALSPEARIDLARQLVFGETYYEAKERIWEKIDQSADRLAKAVNAQQTASSERLLHVLRWQQLLTLLMVSMVVVAALLTWLLVIRPLNRFVAYVRKNETVEASGAQEVRYLASAYNEMRLQTQNRSDQLSYEASHDPLTGASNRRVYQKALAESAGKDLALIIVDIDSFRDFNNQYGHVMGDAVLKRVAGVLRKNFRSEDLICRIGGDEFVVLMSGVTEALSDLVLRKMTAVADELSMPTEETPAITLSVGIAFNDRPEPQGTLFEDADRALYRVKELGRNGRAIYDASMNQKTEGWEELC